MAWKGKIIGGVLGSFMGPWGTAIGVGIGHQFDKASHAQTMGMAIQVAFFGCLAKMAQADGMITKSEIEAVEQIMIRLGYTPVMRNAAIQIFRQAKDDAHTAADYLSQLAAVTHYNHEIGLTFLYALHAIAEADGVIHPNERQILMQAVQAFRLPPRTIDAILGKSSPNGLDEAYQLLGCNPGMTDADIKKSYRKKCVEYHPDKLASKGLPEEFMKYANEQLSKINAAYDTIKKARL